MEGFTQQPNVDFVDTFTCGNVFLGEDKQVCSSQNEFWIALVGHQDDNSKLGIEGRYLQNWTRRIPSEIT